MVLFFYTRRLVLYSELNFTCPPQQQMLHFKQTDTQKKLSVILRQRQILVCHSDSNAANELAKRKKKQTHRISYPIFVSIPICIFEFAQRMLKVALYVWICCFYLTKCVFFFFCRFVDNRKHCGACDQRARIGYCWLFYIKLYFCCCWFYAILCVTTPY